MPEPGKSTSTIAQRKFRRKQSLFHYRMTEDLEEALKKLAKQPKEDDNVLAEVSTEQVVSVPVQLVCTTAMVAVFALPVFYLVSAHYKEEQHYARTLSLKLDLQRFQEMSDATIMEHETKERSLDSSQNGEGLTSEWNNLVVRDVNELFEFESYRENDHTQLHPLEFLFLRLSMARIWLNIHRNYSEGAANESVFPSSAYLNEVRRILLTALLDPITWQGIRYSGLSNLPCVEHRHESLERNCSDRIEQNKVLNSNRGAVPSCTEEDIKMGETQAQSGIQEWFHLPGNSPNNSYDTGPSCEPVTRLFTLQRGMIQPAVLFNEAVWKDLLFDESFQQFLHAQFVLRTRGEVLNLQDALTNMTELVVVHMEAESLFIHRRSLLFSHSSIVVYAVAIFLALPVFFKLTLNKRRELQILSLASGQVLECLSGRVEVLDNHILTVVPKCLLQEARTSRSKIERESRKSIYTKIHSRRKSRREYKEDTVWPKLKCNGCRDGQDSGDESTEIQNTNRNFKEGRIKSDSDTGMKQIKKRSSAEKAEVSTDKAVVVTVAEQGANVELFSAQQHALQPDAPYGKTKRCGAFKSGGVTKVFVQSAATSTRITSSYRATPFVFRAQSSSEYMRDSASGVLFITPSGSSMGQHRRYHHDPTEAQNFELEVTPSQSPSPQIMGQLYQTSFPSIACEQESASDDTRSAACSSRELSAKSTQHFSGPYNVNSPLSHSPSPTYLSPLPQRHSSAPSYFRAFPQHTGSFPCYLNLNPSPQYSYSSSGYLNTPLALSTSTVCLSTCAPSDQHGLSPHPPNTTPMTLNSVSNSADFSPQTFSPSIGKSHSPATERPGVSLRTEESPHKTSYRSSAISTSEVYPKDSCSNTSEKDDTTSKERSPSSNDIHNSPISVATSTREAMSSATKGTSPSHQGIRQPIRKGSAGIKKSATNDMPLNAPRPCPLFLRQISVLAITVPEMEAVKALASHTEFLSILTQLTDLLVERMQQYDVFLVSQKKFTLIIGAGTQGSDMNKHIQELPSLALDFMSSCGDLEIDYSYDRKIRPRIGIHTGPCVAFIPYTERLRCRVVGHVVQHAVQHMELAFPNSILVSAQTCDLLKTAKSPFELVKREFQHEEPRFLQRSRFLSGHLNLSGAWAGVHSDASSLVQLITRPKYSFDSDDLYTPNQHRSPE